MKLIYLGEELDPNIEHDLHLDDELGFNVTIKYSEKRINESKLRNPIEIRCNCTQVHHLFEPLFGDEKKIAFESDIHSTGGWRYVHDIDEVIVELADALYFS